MDGSVLFHYLNSHPELQESTKELCGSPIEVRCEVFPEYAVFAYDAVTTVAMGIQAVLEERLTFT